MNRRSNKILKELILGNQQNVMELVEKYNLQERTIRADIKELNAALQEYGLPLIASDTNGNLFIDTTDKIDVGAYEKFICSHTFYTYYLSKNERSTILAMILLTANGYVTVEQLKEIIGVSRNTLLHDLSELKKWFEENKMELISQVRRGYIVKSSELQIRKGILKLLEVNGDNNDYETGYSLGAFWNFLISQMDKLNIYNDVKTYIIRQEEVLQSFLSDYSFFETAIELTLVANRIAENQTLPEYYADTWMDLKGSSKYIFSSNLLEIIGEKYGLHIPTVEVLYYTDCLKGKSYLKDRTHKSNALDIRLMIAETLYQISRCFGIDFYLDFALYDLLIAHMRSAVYRLQTGETLRNPLKESLLKEYPEVFDIIRKNIGTLEEYIRGEFSEDEMSFMVLYFASVLEKEKVESSRNRKVRVALICETGRGTAQFMLAKLRTLDEMIEIVNISSVHNTNEIKNAGVQMIISTIPLDNVELPCITVRSAMLNTDDLLDIQKMVLEVIGEHMEDHSEIGMDIVNPDDVNIQGAFYNLLSEESIVIDYPARDWKDAVRKSGMLLYETGAVEERYIEAMIGNIEKYGPYVVVCPATALPHADTSEGVIREAASLVRLKTPVEFHHEVNDPVRYVIGMSVKSAESINQAIYDLMMIFGNEKLRQMMDYLPDKKSILDAINHLKTMD
ncbi:MAG: BglG family transcription antiterminator [Eubacteriales bacterium]|nr:BglG family transcription antiterminator [Eubacteriales bacterium]